MRELRGEEATEAAFRREAPRHRWLHLATHGFFAPPELRSAFAATGEGGRSGSFGERRLSDFHPGLLSGLAMAGANAPPAPGEDDGILAAAELA